MSIKLEVDPWCENCSEFDPTVHTDEYYSGGKVWMVDTRVTCKHRVRCTSIKECIERSIREEARDDDDLR